MNAPSYSLARCTVPRPPASRLDWSPHQYQRRTANGRIVLGFGGSCAAWLCPDGAWEVVGPTITLFEVLFITLPIWVMVVFGTLSWIVLRYIDRARACETRATFAE